MEALLEKQATWRPKDHPHPMVYQSFVHVDHLPKRMAMKSIEIHWNPLKSMVLNKSTGSTTRTRTASWNAMRLSNWPRTWICWWVKGQITQGTHYWHYTTHHVGNCAKPYFRVLCHLISYEDPWIPAMNWGEEQGRCDPPPLEPFQETSMGETHFARGRKHIGSSRLAPKTWTLT